VYVDFILGNYQVFGHDYLIDERVVSKAAVTSSIALVSFLIGYMLNQTSVVFQTRTSQTANKSILPDKGLITAAYFLFAIFLATVDLRYFVGGYGNANDGIVLEGKSYYAHLYLLYSILGIIIINIRNQLVRGNTSSIVGYLKEFNLVFLCLLFVYGFLVLISGDRGPIIQIAIAMIGGYVIVTKHKFSKVSVFSFIALAALIVSFIAYIRLFTDVESYREKIEMAYERATVTKRNNSISPVTVELAASVRTLHGSIIYTETNGNAWGAFQASQIIGIVPGLGMLAQSLFGFEITEYRSGVVITKLLLGSNPSHGLGTSAVADIYMDFGVVGVTIFFLLFGSTVKSLENKVFSNKMASLFWFVIFFIVLSKSVYIGRSTIMILIRESIQVYIVIGVGILMSRILIPKRKNRHESFMCN